MRKYLLFLCMSFWAFSQDNIDGTIARINGTVITESDINEAIAQRVFYLHRQYQKEEEQEILEKEIDKARKEALDNLINKKMVLFEFQEREYQLPPTAIDQRINRQIEHYAAGSREEFFRLLEKEGLSFDDLKKSIGDDIAVDIMYNSFVFGRISIGPKLKKKYYVNHKDDFTSGDRVELQAFVILRSNYDSDKEFQDRLIRLSEALKKTDNFSEMVRQNNEDPSGSEDGDHGWQNVDDLYGVFREKIIPLKKGETLFEPAINEVKDDKLAYFFHIKDREYGELAPYQKVESQIEDILRRQKGQSLLKSYLAKLKNKAAIEIFDE